MSKSKKEKYPAEAAEAAEQKLKDSGRFAEQQIYDPKYKIYRRKVIFIPNTAP
jgi:hypothetical protein